MPTMRYEKAHLVNTSVELDDSEFVECIFDNCKMIYRGGLPPVLNFCTYNTCEFIFLDAANRTLFTLSALYQIGLRDMIDLIIAEVRGVPPKTGGSAPIH